MTDETPSSWTAHEHEAIQDHPGSIVNIDVTLNRSLHAAKLRIGGFVPFTAIDYPDHLAAVIFCQGCPWRCSYCQNPHLLPSRSATEITWRAVASLLERRRSLLDAVVFSGGEPTLQSALPAAIRAVRAMGYKIGLHTAGIYPKRLAQVLPLVDWIGLDVKAPFGDYERVTSVRSSGEAARASLELVVASGVAYEVRTTVDQQILAHQHVNELSCELARMGVAKHVLQTCRAQRLTPRRLAIARPSAPI